MFGLGFQELLIIGAVAVMLFGKRLPEVAKSFGAQYREFRRGLSEIQSQMDFSDTSTNYPHQHASPPVGLPNYGDEDADDVDEPTAPKLELPDRDETQSAS